jgi:hypothetical protein
MTLIERASESLRRHRRLVGNVARVLVTGTGITLVALQINPGELWQSLLLADSRPGYSSGRCAGGRCWRRSARPPA